MKNRNSAEKLSLELKYCERCGGLWLRPVGGQQTYCTGCARTMAEFPSAAWEEEGPRGSQGRCEEERAGGEDRYQNERGRNVDTAGGVA
jgi:coenzyme F420-reducing hydrogenase gamma subunit